MYGIISEHCLICFDFLFSTFWIYFSNKFDKLLRFTVIFCVKFALTWCIKQVYRSELFNSYFPILLSTLWKQYHHIQQWFNLTFTLHHFLWKSSKNCWHLSGSLGLNFLAKVLRNSLLASGVTPKYGHPAHSCSHPRTTAPTSFIMTRSHNIGNIRHTSYWALLHSEIILK